MKKQLFEGSVSKLLYLLVFLFSIACEPEKEPDPDPSSIVEDNAAARTTFFELQSSGKNWSLSRLTFTEPTVVPDLFADPDEIDSTYITDLYELLANCRKDDTYQFRYEYGNLGVDFTDEVNQQDARCNNNEPTFIESGIYLEFDDSLKTAQASFENNAALHQFFGFEGELSGTGYLGYEMEWNIISLSRDSINVQGKFIKVEYPNIMIQFIPSN